MADVAAARDADVLWCHRCRREVVPEMAIDPCCRDCGGGAVEAFVASSDGAATDPRIFSTPVVRRDPARLLDADIEIDSILISSVMDAPYYRQEPRHYVDFMGRQLPVLMQRHAAAAAAAPLPDDGSNPIEIPQLENGIDGRDFVLGDYLLGLGGEDEEAALESLLARMVAFGGRRGASPASKAAIDILCVVPHDSVPEGAGECCVCCDNLVLASATGSGCAADDDSAPAEVVKLECQHYFHRPCIVPWLEEHGICPVCRTAVTAVSAEVG